MTMSGSKCAVRVGSDLSEPFTKNRAVRQGDVLPCILLNFAGEKAVRWSAPSHPVRQLLGYGALGEAFLVLDDEAKKLGLVVNESKTKYMKVGSAGVGTGSFVVWLYKFERI